MMRFKDNEEDEEKPTWSSLISLGHVLPYISGNHVSQLCQRVVLIHQYCRRERLALHKLGIHMRVVVDVSILDEDDSDDDMMRFKDNEEDEEKPSWSSLLSLVQVLPSYQ